MSESKSAIGSSTAEAFGLPALDYEIPGHASSLWYALGGITFGLFLWTLISGLLLTQWYDPSVEGAWQSVLVMATQKPYAGIIRGLHYWGANLMFALLIVHMLRVIWTYAYRWPRTVNYFVGLLLLGITFNLYFSGTVLKWDQEGIEALAHFTAIAEMLGPLGEFLTADFTLTNEMLQRVYSWHIAVFPILFLALIGAHFFYVRYHGISPRPGEEENDGGDHNQDRPELEGGNRKGETGHSFLSHAQGLAGWALISLGGLILLAMYFPPGLLNEAVRGMEVTKPPWPFWVFYMPESWFGMNGLVWGSVLITSFLVLLPFINWRDPDPESSRARLVRILLVAGFLLWLVLTVWTPLAPYAEHGVT